MCHVMDVCPSHDQGEPVLAMGHLKVNKGEMEVVLLLNQVGPAEDTLPQSYGAGPCPTSFRHLHLVVLLTRYETKPDVAEHPELDLRNEANRHAVKTPSRGVSSEDSHTTT